MQASPRPAVRRVILNMHMPKTGGTTLDKALGRSFGPAHLNMSYMVERGPEAGRPGRHLTWDEVARMDDLSGADALWSLSTADVIGMLDGRADVVSMSRHGLYVDPRCLKEGAGSAECGGYDIRPIFFVREFASWHASLYYQQRRDPDKTVRLSRDPRAVLAKTGSLREYTRFCVDNARMLANHRIMHNWSREETGAVLDNIGLYQVGLVERYDESLVAIEDALSADFPGLDLSYPRPLNVGPGGARAGRGGLERLVGGDLLRELEAAYDERWIYDKISSELDSRVSRVRNFRAKLGAFRARCARLRAEDPA